MTEPVAIGTIATQDFHNLGYSQACGELLKTKRKLEVDHPRTMRIFWPSAIAGFVLAMYLAHDDGNFNPPIKGSIVYIVMGCLWLFIAGVLLLVEKLEVRGLRCTLHEAGEERIRRAKHYAGLAARVDSYNRQVALLRRIDQVGGEEVEVPQRTVRRLIKEQAELNTELRPHLLAALGNAYAHEVGRGHPDLTFTQELAEQVFAATLIQEANGSLVFAGPDALAIAADDADRERELADRIEAVAQEVREAQPQDAQK